MPAPETLRELRRGQIVAIARKIVAEEGLEALTIGSLEARLAFSRGVITYHFQNKDDIVHAVLESAIDEINAGTAAQLAPNMSADEKLKTALRTYIRGFVEHVEATKDPAVVLGPHQLRQARAQGQRDAVRHLPQGGGADD